jgi:hypothetical protein
MPGTLYCDAAPVSLMSWPILRRDGPTGEFYRFPPTQENVERRIRDEGLQVTSWRIIGYEDIPKERLYRNAIRDAGDGPLHHDMDHAREIMLGFLREDRGGAFGELDFAYAMAQRAGDTKTMAVLDQQLQELRDLPVVAAEAIKGCATIAEMEAAVPDVAAVRARQKAALAGVAAEVIP